MHRKVISYITLGVLLPLWAYLALWPEAPREHRLKASSQQDPHAELKALDDIDAPVLGEREIRIRKSLWYAAKQETFRNLLLQEKYDVIVIPTTPQARPIDQIGRSLITREFVWRLRERAGLRAPDPDFVEFALGENQRTHSYEEALKLARATGATSIVRLSVGYTEPGKLRVSGILDNLPTVPAKGSGRRNQPDTGTVYGSWEGEFSHQKVPWDSFKTVLPAIATTFQLENRRPPPSRHFREHAHLDLPERPEDLFKDNLNPLIGAYYLQLLGALYPDAPSRGRERLFERSLIALNFISPDSADYRVLKARALFHLHRRPAALAVLGKPESPAEHALFALLQGNLSTLKRRVQSIPGEIDRLLAFLEMRDLEYSYDDNDHLPIEEISVGQTAWKEFIDQRLPENYDWHVPETATVKIALDQMFPYERLATNALIDGKRPPYGAAVFLNTSEADFVKWTIEHAAALVKTKPELWCCPKAQWHPSRLDWLIWFEARAISNLSKRIEHEIFMQGRDRRALEIIDETYELFDGHPRFSVLRAWASSELIKTASSAERMRLFRNSFDDAAHAAAWNGGQSQTAYWAAEVLRWIDKLDGLDPETIVEDYNLRKRYFKKLYEKDFPPRPSYSGANNTKPLKSALQGRAWEYSHDQPHHLYEMAVQMARRRQLDAAEALLDENSDRFEGCPYLIKLIARYKKMIRDKAGLEKLYNDAIASQSAEWSPYWEVGKDKIEAGNYSDASKTFLSYPPFSGASSKHRVRLSNLAYDAGIELFLHGAVDEARPLFELSAGYRTGSHASLSSEIELALLDGDFKTATEIAARRAARYPSARSYANYIMLLHTLGFAEPAYAAFDMLVPKMTDPKLWDAQLVGHRIQGKSNAEIATWLRDRVNLAERHRRRNLPGRHTFMAFLIDRNPDDSIFAFLEEIGTNYRARVANKMSTVIDLGQGPFAVGPGSFFPNTDLPDDPEFIAQPESVYFAKGYSALLSKNYETAFHNFREQDRFYGFGGEKTGQYLAPYLIRAAILAGKNSISDHFLEKFTGRIYHGFDLHIAHALALAAKSDHQLSIRHLKTAARSTPAVDMRPVFPWYQLVEAAEWLYKDSGREEYRELALEWAIAHQRIRPMFAWAYAVEAVLTDDPERRRRAIGFTQYLDRQSRRLQMIPEPEREAARVYFQEINPFRVEETEKPSGGA